ncbi:MAG TPA: hypothetical protein VL049_26705 [Candidatus Dormibacteraeota bacterium]|nr:hypothetical protein [Candidatus Dormibacteraeota bacterium]
MKITSMLIAGVASAMLASAALADHGCRYSGIAYSHGSTVCQSGTQYRCDDGEWQSLAVQCNGDGTSPICDYQGTSYSSGSTSCQTGTQYRCTDGVWKSLAVACSGGAPLPDVAPQPPRTCMLEGTTVASASTVCKEGVTFLCNDGDWRNLGTPCR